MGRKSNFTPKETAIILNYPGEPIEVVNAALKRAGFPERKADEVTKHRYYMVHKAPETQRRESRLATLVAKRDKIFSELQLIDKRHDSLSGELRIVEEWIKDEVAADAPEAAKTGRGDAAPSTSSLAARSS